MTSSSMFDLGDRVAMITGGNGGIGRGIALALAGAGASVAIVGRNPDKNAAVLQELDGIGRPAMARVLDVTDRTALAPAVLEIERRLGDIDILVNNAGIASVSGGVLQETPADWDRVIETQLTAGFLLSKLVGEGMRQRRRGKIINVASMFAYFGSGFAPSYSAAKGAIVQLTKSMAIELAVHNIQVNAIAPGWIESDLTAPLRGTPIDDEILMRTPAGRWGVPGDLAGTAVYLASTASDFVTGETIRVDGGYAIR